MSSWDGYGINALNAAVDFFENFLSDVNRIKLCKWIKNSVEPTDVSENDDYYWKIMNCFCSYGEDPFCRLFLKFSSDTDVWEVFSNSYKYT